MIKISFYHVVNFLATTKHKLWVFWFLLKACRALIWRGIIHDLSKYSKEEAPYFALNIKKLKGLEYGSDEYKNCLKELGPAIQHHYQSNSHHPEYYGTIEAMSPLDLIELLCDWKSAGLRHKTGSIKKSLEVNIKRYNIPLNCVLGLERDINEIGLYDK